MITRSSRLLVNEVEQSTNCAAADVTTRTQILSSPDLAANLSFGWLRTPLKGHLQGLQLHA